MDWIPGEGWIVLLNEDGNRLLPQEQHSFLWHVIRGGAEFRHLSAHTFHIPRERSAHAVAVYFDADVLAFSYLLPGRPITGTLEIERFEEDGNGWIV